VGQQRAVEIGAGRQREHRVRHAEAGAGRDGIAERLAADRHPRAPFRTRGEHDAGQRHHHSGRLENVQMLAAQQPGEHRDADAGRGDRRDQRQRGADHRAVEGGQREGPEHAGPGAEQEVAAARHGLKGQYGEQQREGERLRDQHGGGWVHAPRHQAAAEIGCPPQGRGQQGQQRVHGAAPAITLAPARPPAAAGARPPGRKSAAASAKRPPGGVVRDIIAG
jgi:hypothetical protein